MKRRGVVKPKPRFRSAVTGKYVSHAFALANPDTTVSELVKDTPAPPH